jgi:YD repeat-containing protein
MLENKNGKLVGGSGSWMTETNFNSDKTKIEVVLNANFRKESYIFTPQGKLTNWDLYENDGRHLGTKATYTYDSEGRMSEVVNYLLGSFSYKENFSYIANERCVQIKRQFKLGEQSNTVIEINCFDSKGNIISSALYETDKSLQTKEIYKYDERGNPIEFLAYDAKGKLLTKEKYEYEFDSQGNWIKEKTQSWNWDECKKVEKFVRIIKRTISYY